MVSDKIDYNRFYKYDTEESEDIAQELGVNMMPTFHIFKDGDVMDSVTGAKGAALEKAIQECYDGKVVEE
jgi:thioredoxin 1